MDVPALVRSLSTWSHVACVLNHRKNKNKEKGCQKNLPCGAERQTGKMPASPPSFRRRVDRALQCFGEDDTVDVNFSGTEVSCSAFRGLANARSRFGQRRRWREFGRRLMQIRSMYGSHVEKHRLVEARDRRSRRERYDIPVVCVRSP